MTASVLKQDPDTKGSKERYLLEQNIKHTVFCPNKLCSFEPFMCLDLLEAIRSASTKIRSCSTNFSIGSGIVNQLLQSIDFVVVVVVVAKQSEFVYIRE